MSHVVGTVLIVGITVVLMTTIGAFTLALGGDAGTEVPQFEIDCDTDADIIRHDNGDSVEGSKLTVVNSAVGISSGTYTAGDVLVPSGSGLDVTLETQIRYSQSGGGSAIVAECGP